MRLNGLQTVGTKCESVEMRIVGMLSDLTYQLHFDCIRSHQFQTNNAKRVESAGVCLSHPWKILECATIDHQNQLRMQWPPYCCCRVELLLPISCSWLVLKKKKKKKKLGMADIGATIILSRVSQNSLTITKLWDFGNCDTKDILFWLQCEKKWTCWGILRRCVWKQANKPTLHPLQIEKCFSNTWRPFS